jgi:hypothetical protein
MDVKLPIHDCYGQPGSLSILYTGFDIAVFGFDTLTEDKTYPMLCLGAFAGSQDPALAF